MKFAVIAGARPNFPKVKPVLDALEQRGAETVFVHTGQHYDRQLSDIFFEELGIRAPDEHLGVGSGSHAVQTAQIMVEFEKVVERHRPDVVVVAGDVNSTVACALVGSKLGALIAHVEAGLRSRDWDMPEEVNRVVTDRLSDFLLAPSADAVVNLTHEGYRDDQIYLVGNVMIDTLFANLERAHERFDELAARLGVRPHGYALLTLHRPSNVDDPATFESIVGAIGKIATELPVVFPIHPRTRNRLDAVGEGVPRGVHLTEPFGYLDFIAMQARARLVFTDSGGVQEETTALGVPCLTLRESTERPITVDEGTNRVVGTDPRAIADAARDVMLNPPLARRPALWDGHAADRIADALLAPTPVGGRPRPTAL